MRGRNGLVADVLDQFVCRSPGLLFGFAHDHMQADTEAYGTALAGCALAHIGQLLGHGRRWFAPGQVHIDLLGSQIMGRFGRAAKVQRRIRFLHGRVQRLGVLHPQVLAFEVHGFALQDPTPDFQKFVGDFIAFAVIEEAAVATVLIGVAAGHHIDQQAPAGQSVQSSGHARRDRRRNNPRTDGHQIA